MRWVDLHPPPLPISVRVTVRRSGLDACARIHHHLLGDPPSCRPLVNQTVETNQISLRLGWWRNPWGPAGGFLLPAALGEHWHHSRHPSLLGQTFAQARWRTKVIGWLPS